MREEPIQTVSIENRSDIMKTRMQVRTLARQAGFDPLDQARISLATSTVAAIMGLEKAGEARIRISYLYNGTREGMQVTCTKEGTPPHDMASGVLDDARRMVDDLIVEVLPREGVKITVRKWGAKRRLSSLQD
jgi:hypothetical protein